MQHQYGDRLRAERRRLKLTQTAYAKSVGISQATQVGYESGAHLPNIDYLSRSARLGVDIVLVVLGSPSQKSAVEWLDWDTYIKIVSAIESWLDENLVTVDPEKKLRLAKLLLHRFGADTDIQPEEIAEHLKLVA